MQRFGIERELDTIALGISWFRFVSAARTISPEVLSEFRAMSYNPKINDDILVALVARGLALCVFGPFRGGELLRWQANGLVVQCLGLRC